jgi:hypothetical protein
MADSDSRQLHGDHADYTDSDDMDYEPAVDEEEDDEVDGEDQDEEELLERFLDEVGGLEEEGANEGGLSNSLISDSPLIPFASRLGV